MRRISVPPSLLPLQLAEFEELSPALRKQLVTAAPFNPRTLAFDEALTAAENALTVVRHQRDRYSEALLALYSADLLWRCERWLEALEMAAAAAGCRRRQIPLHPSVQRTSSPNFHSPKRLSPADAGGRAALFVPTL